jgi:hypothetical protein
VGLLQSSGAAAQAPTASGDPEAVEQLRQLNGSLTSLLLLVEEWRTEALQSGAVKAAVELDRGIAFLDQQLRDLVTERNALEKELQSLEESMDRTTRRMDEGSEPTLGELLQGTDREQQLKGQDLELYRGRQRLDHLDARIDEVRRTLEERRAWRELLREDAP